MKTPSLLCIATIVFVSGCATNLPPYAVNESTATVTVKIAQPSHTWKVPGVVFKLEPDENGCLTRRRLQNEIGGGVSWNVFKAKPGDIVAVATASEYSLMTKQACSVAFAFKIEADINWYQMGSTGDCRASGFAYPTPGSSNSRLVKTTTFHYPVSPRMSEPEPSQCIKLPL